MCKYNTRTSYCRWLGKNRGPTIVFEKAIENTNPISDPEDSDIKLVIHGLYNSWNFAVMFPDGGLLNFWANTMEELTTSAPILAMQC